MRIVLLAPGDIIEKSEPELKQRGIDIKIKDWRKDGGSHVPSTERENGGTGKDGESATPGSSGSNGHVGRDGEKSKGNGKEENDSRPGDSRCVRTDDERITKTEIKDGDGDKSGDKQSASAKDSKDAEGDERSADSTVVKGKKIKENEGTDPKITKQLAAERSIDGDGPSGSVYVLTRAVADAINQRSGKQLDVLATLSDLNGKGKCYQISGGVGKIIGLDNDAVKEQIDALNELKSQYDGPNVNALLKRVLRIESSSKLDQMFPKNVDEKQTIGSGVVLATNDPSFLPQSNALFTCPTGDTNWKEVARQATNKTSIRAYTYSEIGSGSEIKEAFLSLIDSL
ncbi:helicase [Umatilla virus]|uniref:Helicase n=1 Tax=Umatilla virus TaxID=40060 RepID=G8DP10_9REOV|nr:helicase [Umatilla virus]AEE98376.1 helicase [Umatilla virus]